MGDVVSYGHDYIDYNAVETQTGAAVILREYTSENCASRDAKTGNIVPLEACEDRFEQGRAVFLSSANPLGLQKSLDVLGSSWLVYKQQSAQPHIIPSLYKPARRSSGGGAWVALLIIIILLGGGGYYFFQEKRGIKEPKKEEGQKKVEELAVTPSEPVVDKKEGEVKEEEVIIVNDTPEVPEVADREPEEEPDKMIEDEEEESEEEPDEATDQGANLDYNIILPPGWPDKVVIKEETARKSSYRLGKSRGVKLRSPHFQITCPVELDEEGAKRVINRYEGTWQVLNALPLDFPKVRAKSSKMFKEELAGNYEDYVRLLGAAAPKHAAASSGIFFGDKTVAYCSSLGIKEDGSVLPIKSPVSGGTVVHELTHQLTIENSQKTWFSEGIATYMGSVPMDDEGFYFNLVVENLQKQKQTAAEGGYRTTVEIPWTLKEFFNLGGEDFQDYRKIGLPLYELSEQLFTFFVHLDGPEGVKALQKYTDTGNPSALLRKRSWKELERVYIATWAELGVDVKFNVTRNKAEDQRKIKKVNQENDKEGRRNAAKKKS